MFGRRPTIPPAVRRRVAMTLIELIVVMGLLAIVAAISAPSLAPFFRGRALDEDARRLLVLTRFARSEAISAGAPMEVWVDAEAGEYGVRAQAGYESAEESERVLFQLGRDLTIEVGEGEEEAEDLVAIRYLSDGTRDDASAASLALSNGRGESKRIELAENGFAYELADTESGS